MVNANANPNRQRHADMDADADRHPFPCAERHADAHIHADTHAYADAHADAHPDCASQIIPVFSVREEIGSRNLSALRPIDARGAAWYNGAYPGSLISDHARSS